MALLILRNITLGFGGPFLLEDVHFQIERGERVCLLGRNGVGKSSFMKIIAKKLEPDEGEILFQPGAHLAYLSQEVPLEGNESVFEMIAKGEGEVQEDVERVIQIMQLNRDAEFKTLSAGLKRRTLLAKALVHHPDILLLDEPTNHLDIDSLYWLEDFLNRYNGALLFVTHDRTFLQKISTRILEIDRGKLYHWNCDYPTYLERKSAALEAEEKQNKLFDKKLAQEEVWIRTGIKARRTRNEGRVRALEKLRRQRHQRREQMGKAVISVQEANRSGNLVLEAQKISFAYEGQDPAIHELSLCLMRGDKIGIIGPNGSGKTTLLRLLLGELTPQSGKIILGTQLEVAYFDQLREQLDEKQSILQNVGLGNDYLTINGKSRHIFSYLQDFLFTPERARCSITDLSGGERNRLLLARLFSRPSNVLVLDEPTNDLDAETIELLEELLMEYSGAILLVSHDRTLLENTATSLLIAQGQGKFHEFLGGYEDWEKQHYKTVSSSRAAKEAKAKNTSSPASSNSSATRIKLNYQEKKELAELPQKIETLEASQKKFHEQMSDPGFYQKERTWIQKQSEALKALEQELEKMYKRWEYLESLVEN
jgi:ATP-binding cassette subfamily F protein uup